MKIPKAEGFSEKKKHSHGTNIVKEMMKNSTKVTSLQTLTNMTFRNFLERSWIKWKELAWKPKDSDYCNIICFTVATRHLDIKPSDLHEEDSHNRLAHTLYLVCTQRIFTKGVSRIFCSTKQKFCHGEKTEARIKSSGCFSYFFPLLQGQKWFHTCLLWNFDVKNEVSFFFLILLDGTTEVFFRNCWIIDWNQFHPFHWNIEGI